MASVPALASSPRRTSSPIRLRIKTAASFLFVPLAMGWLLSVAIDAAPNLLPQEIRISGSADPNGSIWREYDPYMDDFVVFYTAGALARENAQGIYSVDTMHAEEAATLGALESEVIRLPFFNPPPYVAPFALLSFLAPGPAAAVWTFLGMAMFVAALVVMAKRAKRRDQLLFLAIAAIVVSMPFHEVILHGQLTLFLLAAWVAIYVGAIDGDRPWLAAVGLVVLAAKPQLVIVPLGYLLFSRQLGPLWRFAILETGIVIATAAALGSGVYLDWMRLMVQAIGWEDSNGVWTHAMFGWNAFVRALLGNGMQVARAVLSGLLVLGTALFIAAQWRKSLAPANLLAVLILGSLLMSPHLFAQDLLLVGLPILALVGVGANRLVWVSYSLIGWVLTYLHFSLLLPPPDEQEVNFVTLWLALGLIAAAGLSILKSGVERAGPSAAELQDSSIPP